MVVALAIIAIGALAGIIGLILAQGTHRKKQMLANLSPAEQDRLCRDLTACIAAL